MNIDKSFNFRTADCKNCFSTKVLFFLKYEQPSLWQCQSCQGLQHFNSSSIHYEKIYTTDYFEGGEYLDYEGHQAIHEKNFLQKWSLIQPLLPHHPKILELGCAYGYFINFLMNMGHKEVYGVDISKDAIAKAQKKFGSAFGLTAPSDFNPNCLILWDVWEHLQNPVDTISKYVDIMPKGSLIALTTVDAGSVTARWRGANWRQIHPPSHLNYPTRKSFQDFFIKLDWDLKIQSYFGMYRALDVYMAALFKGRKPNLRQKIGLFPIKVNLFDIQFVVAQKK